MPLKTLINKYVLTIFQLNENYWKISLSTPDAQYHQMENLEIMLTYLMVWVVKYKNTASFITVMYKSGSPFPDDFFLGFTNHKDNI